MRNGRQSARFSHSSVNLCQIIHTESAEFRVEHLAAGFVDVEDGGRRRGGELDHPVRTSDRFAVHGVLKPIVHLKSRSVSHQRAPIRARICRVRTYGAASVVGLRSGRTLSRRETQLRLAADVYLRWGSSVFARGGAVA